MRPLRLATATDGNHGRAVAHMAALLGLDATIYAPKETVQARIDGIESEGVRLVVVDGSYDETVVRAAQDAGEHCVIVSDTSWPGYTSIPGAVIDGYATIMAEIDQQIAELGATPPDLVLVQSGVGALAAAVGAHYGAAARPVLASVEPDDAACTLESLAAGKIVTVPGPHRSIMAGLDCGTLSMIAWPVIQARSTSRSPWTTTAPARPCACWRAPASSPARAAPPGSPATSRYSPRPSWRRRASASASAPRPACSSSPRRARPTPTPTRRWSAERSESAVRRETAARSEAQRSGWSRIESGSSNFRVVTPASRNMVLEASSVSVSRYLSERYATSRMPDWMMALAHSLQGNRVV